MNRYPLWKYLTVLAALIIGILYTLPTFYGESPAGEYAGYKSTVRVGPAMIDAVEGTLRSAEIEHTGSFYEQNGPVGTVRFRFATTDEQLKAKDLIEHTLNPDPENPDYTVALNLLPASPNWMASIGAAPMHLGLDLRGGVHFLLEVDMHGALTGRYDTIANDIRSVLRDARIGSSNIERSDLSVVASFDTADERDTALSTLRRSQPDMSFTAGNESAAPFTLSATLTDTAVTQVQTNALRQ